MENNLVWFAEAEYEDGSRVEKYFPYNENGNYGAECKRQYELEAWLIERPGPICVWYSVTCCEA